MDTNVILYSVLILGGMGVLFGLILAVASQVFVIGEAAKAPGNAVLTTGDALEAALAI